VLVETVTCVGKTVVVTAVVIVTVMMLVVAVGQRAVFSLISNIYLKINISTGE